MKIAIYLTGSTYTDISCRFGDFEDWFARGMNPLGFETITIDVTRGDRPDLGEIDGIIITGSPASVAKDPELWVADTIEHLRDILAMDFPTLGVCFGHQVLAAAAGCEVERHPVARELGTIELRQTGAGQQSPLFRDIPERFKVQETHEDVIWDVPDGSGIRALAENEHNSYQALAYTEHIYSVQFHPEITADIMHVYIDIYGKKLLNRGELSEQEYQAIAGNVEESDTGDLIFRNFAEIIRMAK